MNGSRHSISDQDGESEMDEDEEENVERIGDSGRKLSNGTQKKEDEKMSNGDEQIGLNGKAESQEHEEKMVVLNGDGLLASSPDEMSKQQKGSERSGEEKEMIEETSRENPASARRTRRKLTEGKPV